MNTPKSGLSIILAEADSASHSCYNKNTTFALASNQFGIDDIINDQNFSDIDELTLGEDTTYHDLLQLEVQSSLYSDFEEDICEEYEVEDNLYSSDDNEEQEVNCLDLLTSGNLIRLIINNQFIFHQNSNDIEIYSDVYHNSNNLSNNLNVAEMELGYSKGILTEKMLCKHLLIAPAEDDGTYMDDLPAFSETTNILETGLDNFSLLYKSRKEKGKRSNQICSLMHIRIEKTDESSFYESMLSLNQDSFCMESSSDKSEEDCNYSAADMLQIFPTDLDRENSAESSDLKSPPFYGTSDDDTLHREDTIVSNGKTTHHPVNNNSNIQYITLSSRKIQSNEWHCFAKLRFDRASDSLIPGDLKDILTQTCQQQQEQQEFYSNKRKPSVTSSGARSEDIRIVNNNNKNTTTSATTPTLSYSKQSSNSPMPTTTTTTFSLLRSKSSSFATYDHVRKDSITSIKSVQDVNQLLLPSLNQLLILNPHSSSSNLYIPSTPSSIKINDSYLDCDDRSNPILFLREGEMNINPNYSDKNDDNSGSSYLRLVTSIENDFMSKISLHSDDNHTIDKSTAATDSSKEQHIINSKIVSLNDIKDIRARDASSTLSDFTSIEFSLHSRRPEASNNQSKSNDGSTRSIGNSVYSNHSTRHTNNQTSTPSVSSISSISSRHKYSYSTTTTSVSTFSQHHQQPIKLSPSCTKDMSSKPYSAKDLLAWEGTSSSSSDSDSDSNESGRDSGFHEGIINANSDAWRDVNFHDDDDDDDIIENTIEVNNETTKTISEMENHKFSYQKRARFQENPVNITYSPPDNNTELTSTFLTRLFSFRRSKYNNSNNNNNIINNTNNNNTNSSSSTTTTTTTTMMISSSKRNNLLEEKIPRSIPEGDDEDNSDNVLTPR